MLLTHRGWRNFIKTQGGLAPPIFSSLYEKNACFIQKFTIEYDNFYYGPSKLNLIYFWPLQQNSPGSLSAWGQGFKLEIPIY